MFCSKCGAGLPDGSVFCNQCGQAASTQAGQVPVPGQSAASPATSPYAPTSGKALASMIAGIFGLILFLPAIAAIILGHISRSEIRKSNGQLKGNGMATAGLIMGYGVFAFLPFVLIIAAIAIPNLLRARIAANESSALASIRTINTAMISYNTTYPNIGFASSLSALGGISCNPPGSDSACLIDTQLASGRKNGYAFALGAAGKPSTAYQVVAYPLVPNQSGVRTFCSDQSAVIKVGEGESAADCLANGSPLSEAQSD